MSHEIEGAEILSETPRPAANEQLEALVEQAEREDRRAAAQQAKDEAKEQQAEKEPQPSVSQMKEEAARDEFIRGSEGAKIGSVIFAIAGMITPIFPSLAKVYTEGACLALGEAAVPVAQKYGWGTGGGKYSAELGLFFAALPVSVATYFAVTEDLSAQSAKTVEAEK